MVQEYVSILSCFFSVTWQLDDYSLQIILPIQKKRQKRLTMFVHGSQRPMSETVVINNIRTFAVECLFKGVGNDGVQH